jgi:predicted nucleic acid-binding protein
VGRAATPNLWTDAWLAALALTHGCEMVTFDKGFRSFKGVAVSVLDATQA